MLGGAPAPAQSNPTKAPCGLPASGTIVAAETYTLIADCTQTGTLSVNAQATVTINGATFTIKPASAFSDSSLFTSITGNTLELSKVTIDGNNASIATLIATNGGTFTASDVTFRRSMGVNLNVDGAATLTNVLFENNTSQAFHNAATGSGLNVSSFGGAVTVTNAVFRDNYEGGGAISVNAAGSGSVTTSGCLTFSGNMPYNVVGKWTDNSTGTCIGTIGNSGDAVIAAPARLPCGLPGAGNLDRSANYVLRGDCDLSGTPSVLWTISEGVNISIQGNGYRLSGGSGSDYRWIEQAGNGRLTLRNVVVDHARFYSFGTLVVDQATFNDTSDRVFFHLGDASIRNSLFENITTTRPSTNAAVLLVASSYGSGSATFTNAIFRNNSSAGAPVLNTFGSATITLNGCVTFENNSFGNIALPNYSGNVTDNSTGACGPGVIIGPTGPAPEPEPEAKPVEERRSRPETCFQPLGAIGILCRYEEPEATLEVWGITPESEGYFVLSATQRQLDAIQTQGLFASSGDGRVGLRVFGSECVKREPHGKNPRVTTVECVAGQLQRPAGAPIGRYRHLAVSMGPNWEGKVHTVVLDSGVAGHVIGTVDTFTGLPGIVAAPAADSARSPVPEPRPTVIKYARPVSPQPARADGSIAHVVELGDTIWTIGVAYNVHPYRIIALNNLDDPSRGTVAYIHPGQELLIRPAS